MGELNIEAIYEQGTLKLPQELPLQDGQKVYITIHAAATTAKRRRGLIEWKGSQEDLDYLLGPDNHSWAND